MPLTPSERDYLESAAEGYTKTAASTLDAVKRRYIADGLRLAIHLLDTFSGPLPDPLQEGSR